MFRFVYKNILIVITLLSTVGGAISFIQYFARGDDYGLTMYLKSREQVIEVNDQVPRLHVIFNDKKIPSLYVNKIQLQNSGKRALISDFIYEPLTIRTDASNDILQVNTSSTLVTHTAHTISFKWELFNPGEVIEASVFTTKPLEINSTQKIKEITNVNYVDEISNPPTKDRIASLSFIWVLLIFFSIFITRDAILVMKADLKLGPILKLARSLLSSECVDKISFLNELASLYDEYYRSVPNLLLKPEKLIDAISKKIGSVDKISGRDLEVVCEEVRMQVIHGNMYTLRFSGLLIGPLIFGFCVIRIGVALLV